MEKRTALFASIALLASTVSQADAAGFATYFAILTSNGVTTASSGVHTSSRTGVGVYQVNFKPMVSDCSFTVSVTGPIPGFASANRTTGRTIVVSTFSKNGVATNLPSNLILVCGPKIVESIIQNKSEARRVS